MNLLQGTVLLFIFSGLVFTPATADLKVHFLDVFGGDAVLLESDGRTMLIDAGPSDSGNLTRLYLQSLNISSLDTVMITSPEEEKTGAMMNILNLTPSGTFISGAFNSTSNSYQDILNRMSIDQIQITTVSPGDSIPFTDNITVDILYPLNKTGEPVSETLIPRITYGDVNFLLMGDVSEISGDVKSQIIRVADHGSAQGTDPWFLRNVSPDVAIISTEEYKHGPLPPATVSNLENSGATVYQTDRDGTVIVSTDGSTYTIEKLRMEPENTFSIVSVIETRAPAPNQKNN